MNYKYKLESLPGKFILSLVSFIYAFLLAHFGNPDLNNDSGQYYNYGINLIQTGTYGVVAGTPDMNREPGYGFFLALVIKVKDIFFGSVDPLRFIVFCQALLFFWAAWWFSRNIYLSEVERKWFFLLCVLSPTLAGITTAIFSESLASCLVGIFLGSLYNFSRDVETYRRLFFGAMSAITLSGLILTKSYFQYFPYFIFLVAGIFFWRKQKVIATGLIVCAVSGFVANKLWDIRNHQVLGSSYSRYRLTNALAGKIKRVESFNLPEDLPKALTAAVGTNLCGRIYGEKECLNFEIRGADRWGSITEMEYLEKYPGSEELAESNLIGDMLKRYWAHPFKQVLGSALEIIRMSFFEAAPRSVNSLTLNVVVSAWHFGGSLVLLYFFLVGFKREICRGKMDLAGIISVTLIIYHVITMSQITNLVRYVFVIIPLIYIFVVKGLPEKICFHSRDRKLDRWL